MPAPAFRIQLGARGSLLTGLVLLALFAALALLPMVGGVAAQMKQLTDFFTLLAMAQMWNLLAGYAGLVSIGQQAFIGLGAYALYAFADLGNLPVLAALAAAAIVTGVIALLTAPFVFRLQNGYFAVGTWVLAEVFRLIVIQFQQLGAGNGVTIQSLIRIPVAQRQSLIYWLALVVGFGSVLVVTLIMRSRVGLALTSIRDSEAAARSLGVDVFRVKLFIYLVAAVGAGIAGSVIYLQLLRIQPLAAFSVDWTAKLIFIVVIGGLGRVEGPILGAIVFYVLQQALSQFGSLYLILLGCLAIAVVLLLPGGIAGLVARQVPTDLFGIRRRLVTVHQPDASAAVTPDPAGTA